MLGFSAATFTRAVAAVPMPLYSPAWLWDEMARVGGLIFLLFVISSLISGKLSDRWIAAGASISRVRKTALGVGSLGLGISLAAAAVAPETIFVWVLSLSGVFLGMSGGCC